MLADLEREAHPTEISIWRRCQPRTHVPRTRKRNHIRRAYLARGEYRLLRPAPHEDDQLRSAPGSFRRLVHGLAPPASGGGAAAAPGSSRSLPSVLHCLEGGQVATPLRRGAQRRSGSGAGLGPPQATTGRRRATSAATRPSRSRSPAPSSASSSSGVRAAITPARLRRPSSLSQMASPASFRVKSSSSLSPPPATRGR